MSKVIVHRHAVKYLNRLPKETKQRIREILKKLEDDLSFAKTNPWKKVKHQLKIRLLLRSEQN